MKNYYEVLGVDAKANDAQIKKAYLNKLKKYHPDVFDGDKEICEQITEELNSAYAVLRDAEQRKILNKTYGGYRYKKPKEDNFEPKPKEKPQAQSKEDIHEENTDKADKNINKTKENTDKVKKDNTENVPKEEKDMKVLNYTIYGFIGIIVILLIIFFSL